MGKSRRGFLSIMLLAVRNRDWVTLDTLVSPWGLDFLLC